ncbi:MAG: DUF58 domain-containing protein [Treponema sp.]|jgi:uncharacterized protein (DUF58 family)|nr:DUF58 domain-containing protein [Treponema sp.]
MPAPKQRWATVKARGRGLLLAGIPPLLGIFLFSSLYILQFISLFLLFIILGSKIYSEYLIRNIRINRRDGELRGFRHEWIGVELVAENHGRLPAFMLALTDSPGRLAVFRNNKTLCTLRSRSRLTVTWQGYCSDRGIFEIGPALIRCSDPLGLFPFTAAAETSTRLFVYPSPGMIGVKTPGGIPLGTLITMNPLYEDLTRCRSLREYHAGDEPRRINWKASARTASRGMGQGAMMINEYESTISFPLVIFLNLDPYEYPLKYRELYWERVIEAAAALCLMASRERQDLGIIFYTPQRRERVSLIAPASHTLIPILERLAALERPQTEEAEPPEKGSAEGGPEPGGLFRGSARVMLDQGKYLPYGTRLIYAGPDFNDEIYMGLNSLKRYHLSLEYLIIDEKSLPWQVPGNSRRYQMKEGGYEII